MTSPRSKKLSRRFFAREADVVARELIGAILVRRLGNEELRARIVETEAYVGEHDFACHASKGKTKRTAIMFGKAGFAYVYFCYGMHDMLNIVTGKEGVAQAVLIRAAEPLNFHANLSGPGRLARGMKITTADNGEDVIGDEIFFERANIVVQIGVSKRIGVDYAGDWAHALLRFEDLASSHVSGPRKKRGQ